MTHQLQVRIPYFTGLVEDVVSNVLHFDWVGVGNPTPTDYVSLEGLVQQFYAEVFTNASTAGMAPWMRPLLTTMKVYDLVDVPPRVPKHSATTPLASTLASAGSLPTEVSLVISAQADPQSGSPQARRRGRVYIGGIGTGLTAGGSSAFPVPSPTLLANAATAASNMANNGTVIDWIWVVWSRVDSLPYPITNGWVDNAFDTQRRRGQAATARTLWT